MKSVRVSTFINTCYYLDYFVEVCPSGKSKKPKHREAKLETTWHFFSDLEYLSKQPRDEWHPPPPPPPTTPTPTTRK